MLTRKELIEKNKYLLKRLTAEWLVNAALRKRKDVEIAEIVDIETHKTAKLTVTLQEMQVEFETLQDELEVLRYEKQCMQDQLESQEHENIKQLKMQINNLESMMSNGCSNCAPLKDENQKLGKENEDLLKQIHGREPGDNSYLVDNKGLIDEINSLRSQNAYLEQVVENLTQRVSHDISEDDGPNPKDAALQKAQIIIKKLNDECERNCQELINLESRNEMLNRNNHALENDLLRYQKEINEIDDLHHIEQRIRQENAELKAKLKSISQGEDGERAAMESRIAKAEEERTMAEQALDELEAKLKQIENECENVDTEYKEALQKAEDAQNDLEQRDEIISQLQENLKFINDEKDAEIQEIKRIAENAFRNLDSSSNVNSPKKMHGARSPALSPLHKASSFRTTSATKPTSPRLSIFEPEKSISYKEDLALQLQEAYLREGKLRGKILELVEKEAKFMHEHLKSMSELELELRPQIEVWTMRCEEVEQRLNSSIKDNSKLSKLVQDLMKTLTIKDKQMQDQEIIHSNKHKQMESLVFLLQKELKNKHHLMLDEIFPTAQSLLKQTLSESHQKMSQLHNKNQLLEREMGQISESVGALNAYTADQTGDVTTRMQLSQANHDLWHIEKALEERSEIPIPIAQDLEVSSRARMIIKAILARPRIDQNLQTILNENAWIRKEMETRQQELDNLMSDKMRLTSKIQEQHKENNHLQDLLSKAHAEARKELDQVITDTKISSDKRQRHLEESQVELVVLRSQNESLTAQLAKSQEALSKTEKWKPSDQKVKDFETEIHYLGVERDDLKDTVKVLKQQVQNFKKNSNSQGYSPSRQSNEPMRSKFEKLISQKDEYIQQLETMLDDARKSSLNSHRSVSDEDHWKIQKLQHKLDRKRQSFKNHYREFELVLRYLEAKILNRSTNEVESLKSQLASIVAKNKSLDNWIQTLDSRIQIAFGSYAILVDREKSAYSELLGLIKSRIGRGEQQLLIEALNGDASEMDFIAKRVIELIRNALQEPFEGMQMQVTDQEALGSSVEYLQRLERNLKDRYKSMKKVSQKSVEILGNMDNFEFKIGNGRQICEKMIGMFSNFFSQYLSAFSGDLHAYSRVVASLLELTPHIKDRRKNQSRISSAQNSPLVGGNDSLNEIFSAY